MVIRLNVFYMNDKKNDKKLTISDKVKKQIKVINNQKCAKFREENYYKSFEELLQNRKGFADQFIEVYKKFGEEEGTQNMTYGDYNIFARAILLNKKPFLFEGSGETIINKYKNKDELDKKLNECYYKAIDYNKAKQEKEMEEKEEEKNVINTNSIKQSKGKGIK